MSELKNGVVSSARAVEQVPAIEGKTSGTEVEKSKLLRDLRGLLSLNSVNNDDFEKISFFKGTGTNSGEIYVRFPVSGVSEVNVLNSERFKRWLVNNGHDLEFKDAKNAVDNLRAKAEFDEVVEEREICTRIGCNAGKIYLCLYDKEHRVIEIDAEGWSIINEHEAPVLFIPSSSGAIPVPERGGSINDLREFMNVNDDDFRLIVGWLLASLNPDVDRPILWVNGEKGYGKTGLTNLLKKLIDPDATGALAPVNSVRDFKVVASSRYIVGLDNISKITKKWSDTFCRMVTGISFVARKLYTDSTTFSIRSHNSLIINGKNLMPTYDDLEDRCFCITLQKLDKTNRKSKEEINALFEQKRPKILGALLDAVSAALKNTDYNKDIDARMLDTCRFIIKAADTGSLPFSDDDFIATIMKKRDEANSCEISSEPLANIIYAMVEEKLKTEDNAAEIEVYSGTTRELFIKVLQRAHTAEKKELPQETRTFGRRLKEVTKEILSQYGVTAEFDRSSKSRLVTIKYASSANHLSIGYKPENNVNTNTDNTTK